MSYLSIPNYPRDFWYSNRPVYKGDDPVVDISPDKVNQSIKEAIKTLEENPEREVEYGYTGNFVVVVVRGCFGGSDYDVFVSKRCYHSWSGMVDDEDDELAERCSTRPEDDLGELYDVKDLKGSCKRRESE